MNFKSIAAAAGLAFFAASSFAADIDLGGLTAVSATADAASFLADVGDVAVTNGTYDFVANNAIILQVEADGSASDVIAYIDQVGATGSFAMIYQNADGAANGGAIAYIQQNATVQARAVITQR